MSNTMQTKLSAEQFRDLIEHVQWLQTETTSALDNEAPALAERLHARIVELRAARLARANRDLENRRDRTIYSAMLVYARRSE